MWYREMMGIKEHSRAIIGNPPLPFPASPSDAKSVFERNERLESAGQRWGILMQCHCDCSYMHTYPQNLSLSDPEQSQRWFAAAIYILPAACTGSLEAEATDMRGSNVDGEWMEVKRQDGGSYRQAFSFLHFPFLCPA
jgi:hypothetical protein